MRFYSLLHAIRYIRMKTLSKSFSKYLLVLFLLTILALQPYNTAFGAYFNILVTLLQVLGAAFAAIALSRSGPDAETPGDAGGTGIAAQFNVPVGIAAGRFEGHIQDCRWYWDRPSTFPPESQLCRMGTWCWFSFWYIFAFVFTFPRLQMFRKRIISLPFPLPHTAPR
jgi:hypothetical protein